MEKVTIFAPELLSTWEREGKIGFYDRMDLRKTVQVLFRRTLVQKLGVSYIANPEILSPWIISEWKPQFLPACDYEEKTNELWDWEEKYVGSPVQITYEEMPDYEVPTIKIVKIETEKREKVND